ncbi:MAG: hypothetical protein CFE22_14310 [Cytophagaceae bacterium BCCC1]|nr:MAG: hypothetical protein CFE22_14310 [Cytophagaceae bacterium BCCC1]
MKNQKLEIVLEGFDLSESQLKGLEKEVNGLVAKHLVNAQVSKSIGTKLRINPEWLGIWLKKFKNEALLNKAKTFKPF